MMRQYELVELVQDYNPDADEVLLNKAYVYAMQKHGQQTRASGDPYFSHPIEVAAILTELQLDDATIATALLHDTIEDTDATRQEIDALFGKEIGGLVEGLTKLDKINFASKQVAQAENLRKLLLAVATDIRVLLVKLADRLHNMRTLHYVPDDKRARISQETMDIYAPLAGRMGMQDMREELEDLAFQYLQPDTRDALIERLKIITDENENSIAKVQQKLEEIFSEEKLDVKVYGRQKRPYSIFRKMTEKTLSFEQLSDIFGFRVVANNVGDCYRSLGLVHTKWPAVPGRFKDYISTPKQNDYRSIHTTIIGPNNTRVELQIRTEKMHSIAEYGIASHALYKDSVSRRGRQGDEESNAYGWLRRTIDLLDGANDSEDFLEHTKLELFHDQVFCFTPKGRIITLPGGATPIDFAYALHTDIGDTCIGCRINGRSASPISSLNNGDQVEIVRSSARTHPASWEAAAVTGKARSAMRRMRRHDREKQHAAIGRSLLTHKMSLLDVDYDEKKLEPICEKFGAKTVSGLMAQIGRGELESIDVLSELGHNLKLSDIVRPVDKNVAEKLGRSVKSTAFSSLLGDLPISFAANGGALPGDQIVGVLRPEIGITIYPANSPQLEQFEDDTNWIDMTWDLDEGGQDLFPASLAVEVEHAPGALAQLSDILAQHKANITSIDIDASADNFAVISIDLEIPNLKMLTNAVSALRSNPLVGQVRRVLG